jgi:hypothetical protein
MPAFRATSNAGLTSSAIRCQITLPEHFANAITRKRRTDAWSNRSYVNSLRPRTEAQIARHSSLMPERRLRCRGHP